MGFEISYFLYLCLSYRWEPVYQIMDTIFHWNNEIFFCVFLMDVVPNEDSSKYL